MTVTGSGKVGPLNLGLQHRLDDYFVSIMYGQIRSVIVGLLNAFVTPLCNFNYAFPDRLGFVIRPCQIYFHFSLVIYSNLTVV